MSMAARSSDQRFPESLEFSTKVPVKRKRGRVRRPSERNAHGRTSPAECSMSTAQATPELLTYQPHDTLAPATKTIRRKRGPSLSRRTGQNGNVFQTARTTWDPNASSFGRYWIDAPNGRKRRTIALGTCRTRTVAKQKLREHIAANGV